VANCDLAGATDTTGTGRTRAAFVRIGTLAAVSNALLDALTVVAGLAVRAIVIGAAGVGIDTTAVAALFRRRITAGFATRGPGRTACMVGPTGCAGTTITIFAAGVGVNAGTVAALLTRVAAPVATGGAAGNAHMIVVTDLATATIGISTARALIDTGTVAAGLCIRTAILTTRRPTGDARVVVAAGFAGTASIRTIHRRAAIVRHRATRDPCAGRFIGIGDAARADSSWCGNEIALMIAVAGLRQSLVIDRDRCVRI
jgi:hypothetical protein